MLRYKLVFTVPRKYAAICQDAIFAAGGGVIGKYERVSFCIPGRGQFIPGPDADPHTGERGKLEYSDEDRIEITCADAVIRSAVKALKEAHPYEEVAYEVFKIEDF